MNDYVYTVRVGDRIKSVTLSATNDIIAIAAIKDIFSRLKTEHSLISILNETKNTYIVDRR